MACRIGVSSPKIDLGSSSAARVRCRRRSQLGSLLLFTSYAIGEWAGDVEHAIAQFQRQSRQRSRRRSADDLRAAVAGHIATDGTGIAAPGRTSASRSPNTADACRRRNKPRHHRVLFAFSASPSVAGIEAHQQHHVEARAIAQKLLLRIERPCEQGIPANLCRLVSAVWYRRRCRPRQADRRVAGAAIEPDPPAHRHGASTECR